MAEMFTRSELAGIIACVDREYGELYRMYERMDQNFIGTPIYDHLCSIIRKAKKIHDQIEVGVYQYITWYHIAEQKPLLSGEYLATIEGFRVPTCLNYDVKNDSWIGYDEDGTYLDYKVIAWAFMPEAYHAE